MTVVLLDGPMGTELAARGVATRTPLWSAAALTTAPDVVAAIHRDHVEAGASVLRTCTFRTRRRSAGAAWERLAARAVELARGVAPSGVRVAGSLGPLEDCYEPWRAPAAAVAAAEHRELARRLAAEGVDLLVGETFANAEEARIAVAEAAATGRETWISLTAGPNGDLLGPEALAEAAARCVREGARVVLVNCVAAEGTAPFVRALAEVGVPFGAYANGAVWGGRAVTPERYAELALAWRAAGASVFGACCGTGPAYVRATASALEALALEASALEASALEASALADAPAGS